MMLVRGAKDAARAEASGNGVVTRETEDTIVV